MGLDCLHCGRPIQKNQLIRAIVGQPFPVFFPWCDTNCHTRFYEGSEKMKGNAWDECVEILRKRALQQSQEGAKPK